MLTVAFACLVCAVALGAGLFAMIGRGRIPHWALGALHGTLGAAGLAAFLLALRGTRISALGWDVAGLLGIGLLIGLWMAFGARRAVGPSAGMVLAVHVFFGGLGVLLLAGLELG